MSTKKYISLSKLSYFLNNLRNTFASLTHTHSKSEIVDLVVDTELSSTSENPVQNKVLDAEFEAISEAINILDFAIDEANTAAITPSDWNQMDATAPDHIKNRTHYAYTEIVDELVLDECSQEFVAGEATRINISASQLIYRRYKTVTVLWNDNSYICSVGELTESGEYSYAVGDSELTEFPFYIYMNIGKNSVSFYGTAAIDGTHTFSMTTPVETEYVTQLDEKYISYKPGRVVAGQTFTVNGVDKTAESGAEIFNNYDNNIATGLYSHAEGSSAKATGRYSHAEGVSTTSSGQCSHAEGSNTVASGTYSHAEGYYSTAAGYYTHAEGYNTIASSGPQHVQGKYNIKDTENKYAHIVGNGASTARSNAHTLDWEGNAWYQGDVYVGGTSQNDGVKLATEEYVQTYVPSMTRITLTTANWDDETLSQTVTVNGISADEDSQMISFFPVVSSMKNVIESGVYCSAQGENSLTFSCDVIPIDDVTLTVTWQPINMI